MNVYIRCLNNYLNFDCLGTDYGEEPQLSTRARNKAVIHVSEDQTEALNRAQEQETNLSLSEKILLETSKKGDSEEVCTSAKAGQDVELK